MAALAIIVIPVVVRTTEDMLQLIPNTLREAVIALGAPKWKMIVLVCYRAAISGIATGVLLAVARIAGETAPLLLTSFGNSVMSLDLEDFEDSEQQDRLDRARRQTMGRMTLVSQVFGQAQDVITIAALATVQTREL